MFRFLDYLFDPEYLCTTLAESYWIYLSDSGDAGGNRSQIGAFVEPWFPYDFVPENTETSVYIYFAIYAKSALAEQTTPVTFAFSDTASFVSNGAFLDLDVGDLGGQLSWSVPGDVNNNYFSNPSLTVLGRGTNSSLLAMVLNNSRNFAIMNNMHPGTRSMLTITVYIILCCTLSSTPTRRGNSFWTLRCVF